MKKTVYIETSVISYLTARVSRDIVSAARQQLTQEWWDNSRQNFELFVSRLVLKEISGGDAYCLLKNGVFMSRDLYAGRVERNYPWPMKL